MTGLKRNLQEEIRRRLQEFPAVLILGVRQCGKTTLAKRCAPDWAYYDLERARDFDFVSRDYDFFFREHPGEVILDEAQELPELFKNLRGVIDAERERRGRFLLTGSSSPELIRLASDSLAGRLAIVELGTLKMNEFDERPLPPIYSIFEDELAAVSDNFFQNLEVPKDDQGMWARLLWGGYPEPTLGRDDRRFGQWMENYFLTYVERDVRKLFPKLDRLKYRRLVAMLSELSGTIINKAELGRTLDISEVTVRDYLEIAHQTFIWRIIPSFEKSKSKSLIKMPKGIMRDSGLLHFLADVDSRDKLLRYSRLGRSFESFVTEELIRGVQASSALRFFPSYYRTRNGAEIDLILQGRFGVLPIEIKFSTSVRARQLITLKRFVAEYDLPLGLVVNNSDEIKQVADRIVQVPARAI